MKISICLLFSFLVLSIIQPFSLPSILTNNNSFNYNKEIITINDWIQSDYNKYSPDGNSSVLLVMDIDLYGEGKDFPDENFTKQIFESWLEPFEKKFSMNFHISNISTFNPVDNDSLDDSIQKVPVELSWTLKGTNDPEIEGNGYDWLIIYQYHYGTGRNRANALYGNALIIADLQPLWWTSQQLILLHEVGHLFGGRHDQDGNVSSSYWYDGVEKTIMDYDDLHELHINGWNKNDLPIDDKNFDYINSSKYRFDTVDTELDGLPNYYEYRYGLNPNINDSSQDFDYDGLSNIDEFYLGTDPSTIDSDKDGFSDWAESYVGTSPLNSSDIPIVDIPIIEQWTDDTTFKQKEVFLLEWRTISSNPEKFYIYQNGSEKFTNNWINELIQYETKLSSIGLWNFTCLVIDQDGDHSSSTIWIEITKGENVSLTIFGPILSLFILVMLIRKKRTGN